MYLIGLHFFSLNLIFLIVYTAAYYIDYKNDLSQFIKGLFDGIKAMILMIGFISSLFYLSNLISNYFLNSI